MSQENVELVYRLNDAFKRRDLDAYLALCDPEVEYYSRFGELEGGGPYRGHEGVRSWWEKLLAFSPDFRTEIEAVQALGNVTVARVRQRAQGVGSDAPVAQTQWIVTRWRNGKAVWGTSSSARPKPSKPPGCGSRAPTRPRRCGPDRPRAAGLLGLRRALARGLGLKGGDDRGPSARGPLENGRCAMDHQRVYSSVAAGRRSPVSRSQRSK